MVAPRMFRGTSSATGCVAIGNGAANAGAFGAAACAGAAASAGAAGGILCWRSIWSIRACSAATSRARLSRSAGAVWAAAGTGNRQALISSADESLRIILPLKAW